MNPRRLSNYLQDLISDILLVTQATVRARFWDVLLLVLVALIGMTVWWTVLFLRVPVPPAPPETHPCEQTVEEDMWIEDTTTDTLIGLPDHSRHVRRLDPPVEITGADK